MPREAAAACLVGLLGISLAAGGCVRLGVCATLE
jgi:hypothetical protein